MLAALNDNSTSDNLVADSEGNTSKVTMDDLAIGEKTDNDTITKEQKENNLTGASSGGNGEVKTPPINNNILVENEQNIVNKPADIVAEKPAGDNISCEKVNSTKDDDLEENLLGYNERLAVSDEENFEDPSTSSLETSDESDEDIREIEKSSKAMDRPITASEVKVVPNDVVEIGDSDDDFDDEDSDPGLHSTRSESSDPEIDDDDDDDEEGEEEEEEEDDDDDDEDEVGVQQVSGAKDFRAKNGGEREEEEDMESDCDEDEGDDLDESDLANENDSKRNANTHDGDTDDFSESESNDDFSEDDESNNEDYFARKTAEQSAFLNEKKEENYNKDEQTAPLTSCNEQKDDKYISKELNLISDNQLNSSAVHAEPEPQIVTPSMFNPIFHPPTNIADTVEKMTTENEGTVDKILETEHGKCDFQETRQIVSEAGQEAMALNFSARLNDESAKPIDLRNLETAQTQQAFNQSVFNNSLNVNTSQIGQTKPIINEDIVNAFKEVAARVIDENKKLTEGEFFESKKHKASSLSEMLKNLKSSLANEPSAKRPKLMDGEGEATALPNAATPFLHADEPTNNLKVEAKVVEKSSITEVVDLSDSDEESPEDAKSDDDFDDPDDESVKETKTFKRRAESLDDSDSVSRSPSPTDDDDDYDTDDKSMEKPPPPSTPQQLQTQESREQVATQPVPQTATALPNLSTSDLKEILAKFGVPIQSATYTTPTTISTQIFDSSATVSAPEGILPAQEEPTIMPQNIDKATQTVKIPEENTSDLDDQDVEEYEITIRKIPKVVSQPPEPRLATRAEESSPKFTSKGIQTNGLPLVVDRFVVSNENCHVCNRSYIFSSSTRVANPQEAGSSSKLIDRSNQTDTQESQRNSVPNNILNESIKSSSVGLQTGNTKSPAGQKQSVENNNLLDDVEILKALIFNAAKKPKVQPKKREVYRLSDDTEVSLPADFNFNETRAAFPPPLFNRCEQYGYENLYQDPRQNAHTCCCHKRACQNTERDDEQDYNSGQSMPEVDLLQQEYGRYFNDPEQCSSFFRNLRILLESSGVVPTTPRPTQPKPSYRYEHLMPAPQYSHNRKYASMREESYHQRQHHYQQQRGYRQHQHNAKYDEFVYSIDTDDTAEQSAARNIEREHFSYKSHREHGVGFKRPREQPDFDYPSTSNNYNYDDDDDDEQSSTFCYNQAKRRRLNNYQVDPRLAGPRDGQQNFPSGSDWGYQ